MTRALFLALLASCAAQVPYARAPVACQAQAVGLVWQAQYGRTDVPPDIYWVPRSAQNCGKPMHSGARGFLTPDGACAGGYSWRDGVNLVDYDGTWEHTALAHEEAHVVLIRNGAPDPDHHSPMFQPGGAVELANAALAAAHLCGP